MNKNRWNQLIQPAEIVVIAESAPPLLLVIKNLGPREVILATGDCEIDIRRGEVRVLAARGLIAIRNKQCETAGVEMEFMPMAK